MKLIFAGTPDNAALGLELISASHEVVLVITREDAEVGRKRILTPSPVAAKAAELGLPIHKSNRIREQDIAAIKASGADLALVIAYGSLIPEEGLKVLPWWNIHFSLLPLWRGASPLQQSILSGGTGAGVGSDRAVAAGSNIEPRISSYCPCIRSGPGAGGHQLQRAGGRDHVPAWRVGLREVNTVGAGSGDADRAAGRDPAGG